LGPTRLTFFCTALFLIGAGEATAVERLRWRGVAVQGRAPARFESLTEAHVALALRQLGIALASAAPFDAEGGARCNFSTVRVAICEVVVEAGEVRGHRRAEVPYRDAEDLAESLALLVSSTLQGDLGSVVSESPEPDPEPRRQEPPRPEPRFAPPPKEARPRPRSRPSEARIAQRAVVEPDAPQLPPPSPEPPRPPRAPLPPPSVSAAPAPLPGHLILDFGPSVAVGFSGDPTLAGAVLRALYSRGGVLRIGGGLSLEGTEVTRRGFNLSFFRLVAGPRLGAGLRKGRLEADLTGGPALLLLYDDAHLPGVNRTLLSLSFVAGLRFGVALRGPLALVVGVDALASISDQRVQSGAVEVTGFGHWSLDLSLNLGYRL
jgi:hypothetical protein